VKITYREAARDDLTHHFRYYLAELDLPKVAVRFKDSAKKTAQAIRLHPHAGPPYRLRNPQLRNLRSWPIAGFDAIRFYFLAEQDVIRVIRILHGKRDVRRILEGETTAGK
jgi:plasmid stabilization system protein ParE